MFAIIVKLYFYEIKNYPHRRASQILIVFYTGPAQSLLRQCKVVIQQENIKLWKFGLDILTYKIYKLNMISEPLDVKPPCGCCSRDCLRLFMREDVKEWMKIPSH